MDLLSKAKALFSGRRRLDKISVEEIRKERIRLEQIERRIGSEVESLETQKHDLFVRGKDEPSQRQQVGLARKIKQLDMAARAKDRQLAMVSRQLRILSGLSMVKQNQQLVKELGVSSIISKMDMDELQSFVEQAMVEGEFHMERFTQILKTLEGPTDLELVAEEDEDTLAIVAAMQEAKNAEEEGEDVALEGGLRKVDQILRADEGAQQETEGAG